ncbi:MAG: site-specific integrase [Oceanospirillaceae bacterium]
MSSFKATPSLSLPLEQYIIYLQRQPLAHNSLVNYRSDVFRYLDFIADYRLQKWQNISEKQAQAFFWDAHNSGKSRTSINRQLSAVRGFFNYLRRTLQLDFDPLLGLDLPKKSTVAAAAVAAINLPLLLGFTVTDFMTARDKALLTLLIECDINITELAALELFSLNVTQHRLTCVDKNGQQTEITLSEACSDVLKSWMQYRVSIPSLEPTLFISKQGRRLSIRAIQLRVQYRGQQISISNLSVRKLQQAKNQQRLADDKTTLAQTAEHKHGFAQQQLITAYLHAHPRANKND